MNKEDFEWMLGIGLGVVATILVLVVVIVNLIGGK